MSSNENNHDEAAPLLLDGSPNHDYEANGGVKPSYTTKESSTRQYIQDLWRWLRINVKILTMTGLLLGGVIALIVYIALDHNQAPAQPADPICLTPACVLAAAGIIENMDSDYHHINPCEDFSKYVCGGWESKHDLRADQDSVSSGGVMYEKSQETLRRLLEAPYSDTQLSRVSPSTSADRLIFDKIQSAYNACMDDETIKHRASKPLLDVLRKVQEYYPLHSDHGETASFNDRNLHQQKGLLSYGDEPFTRVIAYLSSIGVDAFVTFNVDADDKDPDSVVLSMNALNRPGLPSKEYYQDQDLLKSYAETIGQVLEALLREAQPSPQLGLETSMMFECSEELVKAVVDLEKSLAFASPDEADAEDVMKYYNPRSLTEVHALLPQLSMPYLLSFLAPTGFVPTKVIVGSPSYLEALAQQLNGASHETLRAYLVWKTVQGYVDEVEDEALTPLTRFNNRLRGKDPEASEDRWRTCVKVVDRGLGWILSRFFVEEAFSKDAKAFGDRIIHDIKHQFVEKLSVAEWMSKDVRNVAIEKVHRIIQKIGYPTRSPDLLDATAVEKYYEGVHITNESYFGNALAVAKFDSRREWSKLGKPTNRDEWLMTAVTVNAYYNPPGNEIVFPAGIMQPPIFYDPSLPPYISYGPFGSISGHELTHAFDSSGRHYDQNGNYTDWWDDETIQAFKAKTACFVKQYSNFSILDPEGKTLHVNGKLTLGENIADAGGLSAAFHAWKEIEKKHPSQLLPGLQHFTKEQMFFITYPSLFCGKTRQERAVNLIYKDPHSPSWARILGTVANSREFRKAFDCPKKEPTCELW
ncbi:MAG: hypothetical protein L6R38_002566 [Xanthoria sp. 2 TBL-2021]|nr:MAG: hypothetical protein L6R38_002566 [Xanthoria sp. 2 TBL-2021]